MNDWDPLATGVAKSDATIDGESGTNNIFTDSNSDVYDINGNALSEVETGVYEKIPKEKDGHIVFRAQQISKKIINDDSEEVTVEEPAFPLAGILSNTKFSTGDVPVLASAETIFAKLV
jgi:hypothetical protein